MKKARTCDRCKASDLTRYHGYKCLLGYKVDDNKAIPLEPCPKPVTFKAYARAPRAKN